MKDKYLHRVHVEFWEQLNASKINAMRREFRRKKVAFWEDLWLRSGNR